MGFKSVQELIGDSKSISKVVLFGIGVFTIMTFHLYFMKHPLWKFPFALLLLFFIFLLKQLWTLRRLLNLRKHQLQKSTGSEPK